MIDGIYTLANDVVYDQLVALLNSIEANAGKNIPICVIPYNEQLDKVKAEIATRENVTLFADYASINYWDNFATQVWKNYPRAQKTWREWGLAELYRLPMHRKLCALDGNFDKFIYFDADTLLMSPIDYIYVKLNQYDWVTNDFQYKSELKYIFDGAPDLIKQVLPAEKLPSHIFCAGWFAAKKQIFSADLLTTLLDKLQSGEADVMALGGPDQSLFNYMVLKSDIAYYNFAYDDYENTTGNHWISQFDVQDYVLYDKGRRLTYLHYMSIGASAFTKLCAGEDVDIPYRDVFLHYRYLKSPEQRPQKFIRPNMLIQMQNLTSSFIQQKINNIKLNYRNFKNKVIQ
ncbi:MULTISPECIES: Npun_R2821/Npun_R2822 family protein [Calothrix]|uniref:Sugar transferase n=2 Tax=Calothrix TaxID=1186 RepID=A0ABR8A1X8_9CYAN|nr:MULTISPECIES: Npun_R2821/Npun_R2822 family protein [Calothrix]MBD2193956.1 sugar transferase [Calothrix parietina FACHB-288]MBD2222963.1 sugar transferase [Calothrix anomala FACHB-343]